MTMARESWVGELYTTSELEVMVTVESVRAARFSSSPAETPSTIDRAYRGSSWVVILNESDAPIESGFVTVLRVTVPEVMSENLRTAWEAERVAQVGSQTVLARLMEELNIVGMEISTRESACRGFVKLVWKM